MYQNLKLVDPNAHFNHVVRSLLGGESDQGAGWCPAFDIVETADALVVHADLPGVDPTRVEISVQANVLTIKGEKPVAERPENLKAYRFERRTGAFERTIRLPEGLESAQISAESSHGVLTITLPKRAEILPQRIEVKVKG